MYVFMYICMYKINKYIYYPHPFLSENFQGLNLQLFFSFFCCFFYKTDYEGNPIFPLTSIKKDEYDFLQEKNDQQRRKSFGEKMVSHPLTWKVMILISIGFEALCDMQGNPAPPTAKRVSLSIVCDPSISVELANLSCSSLSLRVLRVGVTFPGL